MQPSPFALLACAVFLARRPSCAASPGSRATLGSVLRRMQGLGDDAVASKRRGLMQLIHPSPTSTPIVHWRGCRVTPRIPFVWGAVWCIVGIMERGRICVWNSLISCNISLKNLGGVLNLDGEGKDHWPNFQQGVKTRAFHANTWNWRLSPTRPFWLLRPLDILLQNSPRWRGKYEVLWNRHNSYVWNCQNGSTYFWWGGLLVSCNCLIMRRSVFSFCSEGERITILMKFISVL